jgi:hypothetical protein
MNRRDIRTLIKTLLIFLGIGIIAGYALFSSQNLIKGPRITIETPLDGSLMSTSTVIVKGQALNIKDIFFNDKPILIDEQGNFSESSLLAPGYNIFVIRAHDKFGRAAEERLHLLLIPPQN